MDINLSKLKLSSPDYCVELLKNGVKPFLSITLQGEISQIDLYCFLKSKYGKPNGIQSFLRADQSNNFINWHYSLQIERICIDIFGSIRFFEILATSDNKEDITNLSKEEILRFFKETIDSHRAEIQVEKSKLEYWDIFLNTYARLSKTIDFYYDAYKKISIQEPITLSSPAVTEKEHRIYMSQMKKITTNVIEKKNYGIVIKMLLPVLGESFINLLLFLLAKDEIKSDSRFLESEFRSQIDIRIKRMHLNCNWISKQYDQSDTRFKDFLVLMNKRNDFLHGNIIPKVNCFDNVYFDGTVPIFLTEKDIVIDFMKQNLFQVTEDEIDTDYNTISHFREFILENIDVHTREQIEKVLVKSDLGFNRKTNRVGILFEDYFMQGFAIKKK